MQIPLSLLTSNMTVRTPKDGSYGGEYNAAVTVSNVRFVSKKDLARKNYVLTDGATGIVFIDALNSKDGFEVPATSLVSIDGADECSVIECAPKTGFNGRVHHWELEVM